MRTRLHLCKPETEYLNLLSELLSQGSYRVDRTGVGAYSLFGRQLRFDLSYQQAQLVPLLTTKKMPFNLVVSELCWFLRGETDAKLLHAQGNTIWNGNTTPEFLQYRGLPYRPGDIGPMYFWQIYHFGAQYRGCEAEYGPDEGVDQMRELLAGLRRDPWSRRHLLTTYNVLDREKGVLYPCHGLIIQFFVGPDSEGEPAELSCHMYQRSADAFLGLPFNIASYGLLTHLIAREVGLRARELIISLGDVHLYSNHIEQARLQCGRVPYVPPRVNIAESPLRELKREDFQLLGYNSHSVLRAPMAV